MVRFANFVCDWVFPVAGGVWIAAMVVMALCIPASYYGGWQMHAIIQTLVDRCFVTALLAAMAVLFPILCQLAWAAGEMAGERLVRRSAMYQRADREVEFWHDAYKSICQELNAERRKKRAG